MLINTEEVSSMSNAMMKNMAANVTFVITAPIPGLFTGLILPA